MTRPPLLLLALLALPWAGLAGAAHARPAPPEVVAAVAGDPVVKGAWRSADTSPGSFHPGRFGPLSPDERELAQTAWRYFLNNTQAQTGLVNAVDKYPSTTLWDTASAIAGITAAQGLGLIDVAEATRRLGAMVDSLGKVQLFRNLCPNKAYNTISAERVDYANRPGEIGCSAIDVGRLLVWMEIVSQRFPALAPRAHKAVEHWNIPALVTGGLLQGAAIAANGSTEMDQEGRLGYEEYAAKAFRMWGLDSGEAEKPQPYELVSLYGVQVPYDARDPRVTGAHNYVVSEAAILDGVEFGWNEPEDPAPDPFDHAVGWFASVANNIYVVQATRYAKTGVLTARTEHQLAGPPYFVYDTMFSDGQAWVTMTDAGQSVPEAASLSAKAAVGLWALWRTPYTDKLFAAARTLETPDRGIREGRLESGAPIDITTANTNGIILETLLYKVQGRLHWPGAPEAAPPLLTPPPSPPPPPPKPTAQAAPAAGPGAAGTELADGPVAPRSAGLHGPLTPAEADAARVAWRYFETNTERATGLVDAAEGYPSTTLWDTASAVAAIICARELGLIDAADAEARLGRIVDVFGRVRLSHGECPNKAYDTVSLRPTDYSDRPAETGCSALDVGRMLIWMRILCDRYPDLRGATEQAVARWNITTLVRGGELWGSTTRQGRAVFRQEGRLGYEQYAAKGFQLWGLRTPVASGHGAAVVSDIDGVPVAHDRRDRRNSGGPNYVVSEPVVLDGLEFGWAPPGAAAPDGGAPDPWAEGTATNIYLAQQTRYRRTGILTARTEHQLLAAPHFVYDTIYSDGTPWATVDALGRPDPAAAAVAAKAAFGLWALWPTPYADRLLAAVLPARDEAHGYYEGLFESGGPIKVYTANNNGVILEALAFKAKGPLVRL